MNIAADRPDEPLLSSQLDTKKHYAPPTGPLTLSLGETKLNRGSISDGTISSSS